ncbi:MAG TPA: hypothetical protein VFV94_06925 [Polyangiaceae bacterium]|nr:hypothetical protein [Polyangiaceae bacterium]
MITRRNVLAGCAAVVSLVVLAPAPAAADGALEPLAIVSSKRGGASELTLYQLKRLYLGDNVQAGGLDLIALNRDAKGAERIGFDASVLGMAPDAVARYWIDRRIRGQSGAPKSVEPSSVIQRVIANLPRAVGYVRMSEVGPDVQVVKIDGRRPSDAGYPIRVAPSSSVAGFWPGPTRHF